MLRSAALVLLLQAVLCPHVSAETASRSINEIVLLALNHSAERAALEKEETAKQALAIQAGLFSNPTLELQGSTGSLTNSPDERSASIGINQEFPLNNKLNLRREAIMREAEAIQRQRDNVTRLLKDEIAILALDYQLTTKRHNLATEQHKLNRELVEVTEERFKAGDIPELELNLAKVELIRAETRLMEAEREKAPQRIRIAALTGLKESDINLSDRFNTPNLSKNTQELINHALASRPDLLALKHEFEKTETDVRLTEAEALPNLTTGFFVQWQRSLTEVGGMSSISSDTQLGLRLSMPIPVFDRNQGGRSAARVRRDAADSRRLALERNIVAEVEAAVSRMAASDRILAMFEQGIIPQLTENLKLTQEAYRIGEVGIISVIEEQKKFFEVNDSFLSALHSRRVSFVRLESATAMDLSGGAQ
jgi:cobalt-zinc-cadmium efflux system outer membrane protein